MTSNVSGTLNWHNSACHFAGSGVTIDQALFNYSANWSAPGRWKIEITTESTKSLFQPLEELKIFNPISMNYENVNIEDTLDRNFKPGLYRQTEAYIGGVDDVICDLSELIENWPYYCQIGNYEL
jgi:hypothetical protein